MTPSCLQPCRRPPFASGWSLNHDHGPHDLRLFTSACQHIIFHHLKNLPLHILFLKALLPPSKHVPFIPPSHPIKGSLFLSCASSPPLPLHLAKAHSEFGFQPLLTTAPSLLLGTLVFPEPWYSPSHASSCCVVCYPSSSQVFENYEVRNHVSPFLHHIPSASAAAATHRTFV